MQLTRSFAALCAVVVVSISSVAAQSPDDFTNQQIDYIVVGGGLTGLTVANRLSADPSKTVLVIEAGRDDRDNPLIWNVDNYGQVFSNDVTQKFPTVQQEGGRTKGLVGGHTLGGSSSINGAAWNRASKSQYDALGQVIGGGADTPADGWNWDGLLNYMKKSEGFVAPNQQQMDAGARIDASVHGFDGPLQIGFSQIRNNWKRSVGGATTKWRRMYTGPQQPAFIKAIAEALGVQQVDDQCSGEANSAAFTPNSIDPNSRRVSAATAYYTPVEQRSNLHLLTSTRVKEIVWQKNGDQLVATGVKVMTDRWGQEWVLPAAKEVILAAGALNTPQILQRSGVGNTNDLQQLGVQTNLELAGVGKNLQDQTMSTMGAQASIDSSGGGPSAAIGMPNIYQMFGGDAENIKNKIVSNMGAWAQKLSDLGHIVSVDGIMLQWNTCIDLIFNKNAPVAELFFNTGWPSNSYGFILWPLLPFSRGSIRAKSTDPWDDAVLDPNYFGIDVDMDMQVQTTRSARRVFNDWNLKQLTWNGETQPGTWLIPDNDQAGDYNQWRDWILGNLGDGNNGFDAVSHQLGTCQMGNQNLGGVVDQKFKVYGTQNVRVVDASVLPTQVSAHLSATLYGVAEKAADVIINDSN